MDGAKFDNARNVSQKLSKLPPSAPEESAMTTVNHKAHTTFKTVDLNVKSLPLMKQSQVEHDIHRATSEGSIIAWQEISPARYRQAIKDLPKEWASYMPHDKGGLPIEDPISWNTKEWTKVDAGFKRTHTGKAKVSPNRYVTWVKLKNKETGQTIVRMNTHTVSAGWSHKPGGVTDRAWRQEKWHEHMAIMKQMVAHFEKQGYPVIVSGDFNRNHDKVLGNEVRYDSGLSAHTHGKSTLDYMMSSRNKELKKLGFRVDDHYASDHNALIGTYELK